MANRKSFKCKYENRPKTRKRASRQQEARPLHSLHNSTDRKVKRKVCAFFSSSFLFLHSSLTVCPVQGLSSVRCQVPSASVLKLLWLMCCWRLDIALPGELHQQYKQHQNVATDQHKEQRCHIFHAHGNDKILRVAVQLHADPYHTMLAIDACLQQTHQSTQSERERVRLVKTTLAESIVTHL